MYIRRETYLNWLIVKKDNGFIKVITGVRRCGKSILLFNLYKEYLLQAGMQNADAFIRNIKKYLEAPELTREMCYELIDRVIVGGHPKVTGKEREIDIVYKVDISSVLRHKLNNPDK